MGSAHQTERFVPLRIPRRAQRGAADTREPLGPRGKQTGSTLRPTQVLKISTTDIGPPPPPNNGCHKQAKTVGTQMGLTHKTLSRDSDPSEKTSYYGDAYPSSPEGNQPAKPRNRPGSKRTPGPDREDSHLDIQNGQTSRPGDTTLEVHMRTRKTQKRIDDIRSQMAMVSQANRGSNPDKKSASFWTLSKSCLDPPPSPPHPFF